ncbi:uncharacterized protein LOC115780029 [Archocentrus centrarchus]|uniref:uncharacterized protein LOC115780029 n=1 Tax=Archocentrus centrarchus TaxID=63155 RepID=UPI0011E9EB66|nr:uncharacterized protein LOC115780029 [Archocentrus centrarchus]
MGCDRVGSLSDSNLLLEISPHGSQDIISSGHSEKRLAQFASVSSNIQVERYKDTPPVCPSIQIPTAGLMEGASPVGCAAQKELQIQEHAGTPGEPDNTDWRQKESQGAEEKNHQCFGEQGDGGVMGEEENRGIKADSMPGLWGKAESDCRSTVLSKPEEEGRKVKNESFKNPWPAEEHLQHLSQTHSGMSEYPPLSPQHVLSTSSNLNIHASSIQTTLFTFPKPPLEINHFYHSQHNWETSVIHNQPTQALTELNSSRHINAGAHLSQTENVFSRTESGLQQTFSVQDQKQTSISLSVQQGNTAAGNNSTAVSSCKKFNLASHQNSNVGTLPPTDSNQVSQVCRVAAGSRGDVQPSKMYHNTGSPSKPFIYPEPDEKHDTTDKAPSDSGRADMTSKYHSLYLASPLHGYQPAEYLNSGVRPVQSCQEYTEDTSSSDDEGKLIIEL